MLCLLSPYSNCIFLFVFKVRDMSPIEAAGGNSSRTISRMKAFLLLTFPPAIVGSLATEHVQSAEQGQHFPQFLHISWQHHQE